MSRDDTREGRWGRPTRWAALGLLAVGGLGLTVMTQWLYPTDHPTTNLSPFRSIVRDCTIGSRRDFVVNFLGNILAFIPMGATLELARVPRLRGGWAVAALGLFSLALELGQYLSGKRHADVDDLILNTLGAAIGAGLVRIVGRRI